jgi:hypothetical protein
MTDPDTLSRDIHALKELQRVAWSQLASPTLTTFDRREIRNRIRQSGAELKTYLQMRSEHMGFPLHPVLDTGQRPAKPQFRLLVAD